MLHIPCCDGEYFDNTSQTCKECEAGFRGINCNETCPSGTFGRGCQSDCNCSKNTCNFVNGACQVFTSNKTDSELTEMNGTFVRLIVIGTGSFFIGIFPCDYCSPTYPYF
ncbi:scavenger receptor class F member 1-like [Saccostrea cucullata]|uniref:scavenger receptor class F member 1-like n=1 Tax=Saccostrea cuccullata TaxID=36930 RepID=UPI002ED11A4A